MFPEAVADLLDHFFFGKCGGNGRQMMGVLIFFRFRGLIQEKDIIITAFGTYYNLLDATFCFSFDHTTILMLLTHRLKRENPEAGRCLIA